jgi:hypothetical protein
MRRYLLENLLGVVEAVVPLELDRAQAQSLDGALDRPGLGGQGGD